MIVKIIEAMRPQQRRSIPCNRGSLSEGKIPYDDHPDDSNNHVVIVMDGMKEFSSESLEWALKNVISAGSVITLLGVMPWLNIPCEYLLKIKYKKYDSQQYCIRARRFSSYKFKSQQLYLKIIYIYIKRLKINLKRS